MNANFKDALEKGFIEPLKLESGNTFELKGVKYYHASESGAKLSMARFHAALDIIRMHEELKLSFDQNKSSWDQVGILSRRILGASDPEAIQNAALEMITIQARIDARMNFGRDIEQVYQIAAIYLIREDEDPSTMDSKKTEDKIKDFKSIPDLYTFFLSLPSNLSLNLSTALEPTTHNYLRELNIQELLELKFFLTNSKLYGLGNDQISSITSRMETLNDSILLLNSLSKNTMTP